MIAFISLLVSSFGFGQILRKFNQQINVVIATALGFCLVPVVIFCSYFLVQFDLRWAFKLTMAISVLGFFLPVYNYFKGSRFSLTKAEQFSLVAMVLTLFAFVVFGETKYAGVVWDELTHWALHPKQILLHNTLISKNFLPGSVTWYLPGLAFLNSYGEGLTGIAISKADFIYGQLLSSMMVIGLLSLLVVKLFDTGENGIYSLVFPSICLSLFLLLFRTEFYPVNNLIEIVQGHAILMFFLLVYLFEVRQPAESVRLICMTVVLAYAYLIKASNLNLLPAAAFYLYLTSESKEKFILNSLKVISVTLAVYLCWKFYLNQSGVENLPLNIKFSFFENLKRRSSIPWTFVKELFTVKFVGLFILSFVLRNYLNRRVTYVIYFYFFTYVLGLLALYLFTFGEFEGLKLASFDRYMNLAFVSIKLHVIIGATFFVKVKLGRLLENIKLKQAILSFCALAFCLNAYARFNVRAAGLNEGIKSTEMYKDVLQRILKVASEQKLDLPKLLFIEQGGGGLGSYFLNYSSFQNGKYNYLTTLEWTFDKSRKDIWTQVKFDFVSFVLEHQIVVVYKSDEWVDSFLQNNAYLFKCADKSLPIIYVKRGREFICFSQK